MWVTERLPPIRTHGAKWGGNGGSECWGDGLPWVRMGPREARLGAKLEGKEGKITPHACPNPPASRGPG